MTSNRFIRIIRWPIVTTIIYGILHDVIYEKLTPWIWGFLNIYEGLWLDTTISIAVIVCIVIGWSHKRNKYSDDHIGIFITALLLVSLFWFESQEPYVYLNVFNKYPIWPLLLGSYLVGLVLHHVYDLFPKKKADKEEVQLDKILLFQDLPVTQIDEDELAFKDQAKRIASSIIQFKGDKSFSIGITGVWGSGKTSLLSFVKHYLGGFNNFIIIDFFPRQSATIQDIQKDFLYELGRKLALYHSGAHRVTEKYMHALGTMPDSMWVARLFGTLGVQDVTEKRTAISKIIKEIKKKIVVFIDDFDRLTGEEIQEVLKLIDKNAAFSNTFFITAYDKVHTNEVIASYLGESGKGRDYTDKYFNLEVAVPVRYNSRYIKLLRQYLYSLNDKGIIESSHNTIDTALPRLYPFISKYLSTVRDIKRYVNLISVKLPIVERDVLLDDFLLTTLISYRYPNEYVRLARHEWISVKGNIGEDKKTYTLHLPDKEILGSKELLNALFSEKTAKSGFRSITHRNSFDHYFYDYDAQDLKYRELSTILDASITPEEFKKTIQPWMSNERTESDLIEFVLSYEHSIQSVDEAKRYLRLFFLTRTYCESKDLYIASLSYLLEGNLEENIKTFKKRDEKEYKGFFKAALNDMFDWPLSVETLHDALHAVNTLDSGEVPKLIFSPEELMGFAKAKLTLALGLIEKNQITNWEVYRVLRACVLEFIPNGPGESYDVEALEKVRQSMNKNPEFFLKDVVGHAKAKNQNSSIQLQFKEDFPFFDLFKSQDGFQRFVTEFPQDTNKELVLFLSQFAEYCVAQKTWKPILSVSGDLGQIKQSDYQMYNKLFEGEPVDA